MELHDLSNENPNTSTTRWHLCVICQENGERNLRAATAISLAKFQQCFVARQKFCDSASEHLLHRLQSELDNLRHEQVKWHRSCYSSFTNKANIKCIETRFLKQVQESNKNGNQQTEDQKERVSRSDIGQTDLSMCILCQKRKRSKGVLESLVQVQSQQVADRLEQIASCDDVIRCRIGVEDPIATEMKYHRSCMRSYQSMKDKSESFFDVAFTELIKYMTSGFMNGKIYTIKDLCDEYNNILSDMGKENTNYKPSRLLKRIFNHFGDQIEKVQCRKNDSTLIFPKTSAATAIKALKRLCDDHSENLTYDNDIISNSGCMENDEQLMARMFYHVAQKIKHDLAVVKGIDKNITDITSETASQIVPESLKILLDLILTNESKKDCDLDIQVLNVAQDIIYAFNKQMTPKHVGIALYVHQATRSKSIIDTLHAAGHCVNYETVRRIETSIGNHMLQKYEKNNNIYIPDNLEQNKFVHFATDNIDILEETIDGKGTFHGTQLIAFQRGQQKKNEDIIPLGKSKTLNKVPTELLNVPIGPNIKNPAVVMPPNMKKDVFSDQPKAQPIHRRDMAWLVCRTENRYDQIIPSWTNMNKLVAEVNHQISKIGYTPILPNPAHEIDTLCTVMKRCQDISHAIGQKYTVITADEALYCKMKQIQWHSEAFNDVIVRLGGFHWVLNFMKVIGKHFAGSGLNEVWVETNVFGENTANNIMEAKQYNHAIRAIKLTCDALWRVLMPQLKEWGLKNDKASTDLFDLFNIEADVSKPNIELMTKWHTIEAKVDAIFELLDEFDKYNKDNSLYQYWRSYIDLAGLVLKFIRAEREGDWSLHIDTLKQMLPWFFIYDHTHYSRWGTVYLMDMISLSETAHDVYKEFCNGNFGVKQTRKSFNEKSPDLALEHVNKIHKIAGGLIGITKNETARDRWCLTFNHRSYLSEMTRNLFGLEYTDAYEDTFKGSSSLKDEADTQKISEVFQKSNLFTNKTEKLINIYTGETASDEIVNDLLSANTRGVKIAEEFLNQRLIEKSVDLYSPLKKNKSKTFKDLYKVNIAVKKSKKDVSVDVNALVMKMFSAVKSGRQIELKQIMQNELKDPPPSLFDENGKLRQTAKSTLANILIEMVETRTALVSEDKYNSAVLIDGQALVQTLGKPKNAANFGDLAKIFNRCIRSHLENRGSQTIHVLFDRYKENSIKSGTREKRKLSVTPVELKILDSGTPLPRKWDRFIHHSSNKANLAKFLAETIAQQAETVEDSPFEIVTAGGFEDPLTVISNVNRELTHLKSNHEEADTRFVTHGIDASQMGLSTIIVNSRDTDVLLLMIHHYEKLPAKVWLQFGTHHKPRYVPVHDIVQKMGPEKNNLLAFHALTGCDSTSSLAGSSKKTGWKVFQEQKNLLKDLATHAKATDQNFRDAEKFVIHMYDKKYHDLENINDLRAAVFQNMKRLDKLPPTRDALKHHIERANYQTFIWKTADQAIQTLPPPDECGWKLENNQLLPVTSLKAPISKKDLELITCQCKTNCRTNRCGCASKKQKCMSGVCHPGTENCFNQYNYDDL